MPNMPPSRSFASRAYCALAQDDRRAALSQKKVGRVAGSRALKRRLGEICRMTYPMRLVSTTLLVVAIAACGDEVSPPFSAASVSAGNGLACSLTNAGVAYCWGNNVYGDLGNGTTIRPRSVPTRVSGGLTFSSVTVGDGAGLIAQHTCARTRAGAAYCWGWNHFSALGDGTSTDSPIPVPVSGGLTFTALSVGGTFTCGLTVTHETYCWDKTTTGTSAIAPR